MTHPTGGFTAGPDDVVGHKTMRDGSHEPLRRAEAEAIMAECDRAKAERERLMPDERAAIRMMTDAHQRLRELGWCDAIYCPKDGSSFEVIEAGSSGIHRCHYSGEWPKGSWWIEDGDLWPSRPTLFRLYPEDEAKRQAKMEEARQKYREVDALHKSTASKASETGGEG